MFANTGFSLLGCCAVPHIAVEVDAIATSEHVPAPSSPVGMPLGDDDRRPEPMDGAHIEKAASLATLATGLPGEGRAAPQPLDGVEKVASAASLTTLTTGTPGEGGTSLGQAPATPQPLEQGRKAKADLSASLQEETLSSIMGFATPRDVRLAAPPRGPMLLGRTSAETFDQVKSRASVARKQQRLRAFLVSSGFAEVNARKDTGTLRRGFTFPLHAAVASNDAEAVEVLLSEGADRASLDSRQLTPLALARKLDKSGSHGRIISLLEA